jgi:hypothetical protein
MQLTTSIIRTKLMDQGRCCIRSLIVSSYCGSCNCMQHSDTEITSVTFGIRFIDDLEWWLCMTVFLSMTHLFGRFMWIMGVCIPISVKSQFKKKVPRFTIFLAVVRVRLFNRIFNCEPCSGLVIRWQMKILYCDILKIWKEREPLIFNH